ncbi:bifunctional protein-serine/threonine kinase/phosphatase [Microbulbifer pacificus]|uniref:Bifunctional protein-serine/threonine kinase/phosphatase n=1 Tax=Microbulbifer pacificus TaxID=407164 RepID=A0AAU0MY48_9GAMM|nr:bifunctional protein-serine/threonine kinase/phosphatase [Microbulbifer pacificus]WOX04686.1 bifunctional protein-serine/threonine kinase/phosphatase [Microbulbifer pacificus]
MADPCNSLPDTERVAFATATEGGQRAYNDDAVAIYRASGSELRYRGSLAAIADGVGSAEAGGAAARAAVSGFISDYYSTPDSWSVKQAAARVLHALNSWLYRQSGGADEVQRGWLTTFSAVVFKGSTAHLIHIGDSRIYRLRNGNLECLTRDHSRTLGPERTFLSRALGMDAYIEVDYRQEPLEAGDLFCITTDGIHDFLPSAQFAGLLQTHQLSAAQPLIAAALDNGSKDNLSLALCRVNLLDSPEADDLMLATSQLPFPPSMQPGNKIDGYEVLQELHASSRSYLYLVRDLDSGALCVLKAPSENFIDDPVYIERFIAEEWTGRRVDHPAIVKVFPPKKERRFLYHVMEYVDGQNLRQWMQLNPEPPLDQVRNLVAQLVSALRRLQRLEIVHGDLKPENIMVDSSGRLKLIDLGGANAAGLQELLRYQDSAPPGSKNYCAPEYFVGDGASHRSDIFSLGVIAYEMLTGHYPYKERFGSSHYQLKNYAALRYISARQYRDDIPFWIDGALRRACAPDPKSRYPALSEFVHDLSIPNSRFTSAERPPLLERNPLLFWQTVAALAILSHLLYFM